jgi:hypothetical protein
VIALYKLSEDISEKHDLKSSYPEMAASLEQQMMEYLDSVGAEEVNQLRAGFLKNIEGEWLTKAEARADSNRVAAAAGNVQARQQLAEAEKFIKWLKQEAIFTRERMAMSEGIK